MRKTPALVALVLALGLCATLAKPSPKHRMLKRPCKECGGGSKAWPGHLQPMGQHAEPMEGPDEIQVDEHGHITLTPQEFYRKYVRETRPLVLRGAIRNQKYFKSWSDEYLASEYGTTGCMTEDQKKEDRGTGNTRTESLTSFLGRYNSSEVFMVQDVYDHMLQDVQLPSFLNCEEMWQGMNMVVMWMSSGGTASVLHNDEQENLLTMVDGTKEVLLWSPEQAKSLYVGAAKIPGISPVDQAAVDLELFPRFREAPYLKASLGPGDALYIPRKYWHQVNSGNSRNLAVNIWWHSNDQEAPYSLPEEDSFPGNIDPDGGYGGYKRKWPQELVCGKPWREASMAAMEVKDHEYQDGLQQHKETYQPPKKQHREL